MQSHGEFSHLTEQAIFGIVALTIRNYLFLICSAIVDSHFKNNILSIFIKCIQKYEKF
jgi:hypothetical protein